MKQNYYEMMKPKLSFKKLLTFILLTPKGRECVLIVAFFNNKKIVLNAAFYCAISKKRCRRVEREKKKKASMNGSDSQNRKCHLPCLPTISATCSELGTGTHSVVFWLFLLRDSDS